MQKKEDVADKKKVKGEIGRVFAGEGDILEEEVGVYFTLLYNLFYFAM